MPNPEIVLLHGWAGDLHSYGRLPELLVAHGYPVRWLHLGRYTSGDDDLSIDDYAIALDRAVRERVAARPFDVIVHSTGALVVRSWLSRFFAPAAVSPVRKLVLAAPANNGSRLAAWGKKVPWDWGNKLLEALRLGSRYTWELNWEWLESRRHTRMRGLEIFHLQGFKNDIAFPGFLDKAEDFFDIDIPVFEERGSDNTVRYCAANPNLNGARLALGEATADVVPASISGIPTFAFRDRSHFGEKHGILGAIRRDDDRVFVLIRKILDGARLPRPSRPDDDPRRLGFMMLNLRVVDQLGNPHEDFLPRFYFGAREEKGQIEVVHRHENREIDCYYFRYRNLAKVSRFGFRIEANRVGNAFFPQSREIDLYWPERDVHLLEKGQTALLEVRIEKSLDREALDLEPPPLAS